MAKIDSYRLVELPDDLGDFNNQKVGEMLFSKEYECVRFHCPCGCGIQVYLPVTLDVKKDHAWLFNKESVTISPSIQQNGHCLSHYHIQNGKTVWS